MEYYVYQLRVEGEELPFYIGKGKGDRAYHHTTPKELSEGRNLHKKNKILKAQRQDKRILVEMVHTELTEEESIICEVFYIAKYGRADLKLGPLTNLTDGGEGLSGFKHSEETLRKLSEAASGENNPWYGIGPMNGKKHNDLTIAKFRQTRKKENNAFFNKNHTEETKAAMSLAKKGKPQTSDGFLGGTHTEEAKARIKASCAKKQWRITRPDGTVEIINNLRDYCRDHNLTAPNMIVVANGKQNSHKGYKCERME